MIVKSTFLLKLSIVKKAVVYSYFSASISTDKTQKPLKLGIFNFRKISLLSISLSCLSTQPCTIISMQTYQIIHVFVQTGRCLLQCHSEDKLIHLLILHRHIDHLKEKKSLKKDCLCCKASAVNSKKIADELLPMNAVKVMGKATTGNNTCTECYL